MLTSFPAPEQTSRCLILKNMFDRLSEEAGSNPNYFLELADDVRGECAKLGAVLHCACDKWSNGFVYLKMLALKDMIAQYWGKLYQTKLMAEDIDGVLLLMQGF